MSKGFSAGLARNRANFRLGFGTGFIASTLVGGSGEASFSTVYERVRLGFGKQFILLTVELLSRPSLIL